MKKILLIALVLLLGGCAETSTPKPTMSKIVNQATYTISGVKDKRLDAWYIASYLGQNLTNPECYHQRKLTGGKRPKTTGQSIQVPDGNYTIELPIIVNKTENECNYKFIGLKLIMKRKYDKELASIHYILSENKKVKPIYWKTKSGASGSGNNPTTPPTLGTFKEFFRIAKDTKFLCKTFFAPIVNRSTFHCTMQINSDVNRSLYKRDEKTYAYHHPSFGVDEIKDTKMSIDILVDSKNSKTVIDKKVMQAEFKELEKPSIWNKIF